jgi:hypothetical protein
VKSLLKNWILMCVLALVFLWAAEAKAAWYCQIYERTDENLTYDNASGSHSRSASGGETSGSVSISANGYGSEDSDCCWDSSVYGEVTAEVEYRFTWWDEFHPVGTNALNVTWEVTNGSGSINCDGETGGTGPTGWGGCFNHCHADASASTSFSADGEEGLYCDGDGWCTCATGGDATVSHSHDATNGSYSYSSGDHEYKDPNCACFDADFDWTMTSGWTGSSMNGYGVAQFSIFFEVELWIDGGGDFEDSSHESYGDSSYWAEAESGFEWEISIPSEVIFDDPPN